MQRLRMVTQPFPYMSARFSYLTLYPRRPAIEITCTFFRDAALLVGLTSANPTPGPSRRPASTLPIRIMIARTATLAALLAAMCPFTTPVSAQPAVAVVAQTQLTDESTCTRLGLGAEQLAAAGLTTQQTGGLVEAFIAELEGGGRAALAEADSALLTARRSLAALTLATAGGQGDESEVAARLAAEAVAASCKSNVDAALTSLYEAATGVLSEATTSRLTTMRSNLDRGVPVQFTVRSFEEGGDEWVALRAALNDERCSAQSGLDSDTACQALLSTWRSNEAVATAKSNLDTNLAAIQTAWTASFAD